MKRILILIIILQLTLVGCNNSNTLSKNELNAFNEILNTELNTEDLINKSEEMITPVVKDKFPAIKKVFVTNDNIYLFVAKPIAYNGPITLAIAIDGNENKTIGIRVVKHSESKHYVRDFENNWFTDRFSHKEVNKYLKPVHLEAKNDDEVIIITGATTTTEGVVNGVNAAIGMYNEAVLKNDMPGVELKAKIIK